MRRSHTPAAALPLLFLLVFCAASLPSIARAFEFGYTPNRKEYQSPQHFALEIKFGTFSPHIDSSPGLDPGATPFADLFNNQYDGTPKGQLPSRKLLTTIEFDWQLWHGFGSLGLAGSVGFSRRTTHSFQYDMSNGLQSCQVPNCVRSGDTTALNLLPLTLEVVYRFDVLTRYKIPFVPYFKIGLGYTIWISQAGDSSVSKALDKLPNGDTDSGAGGTAGFVMHPGLAFQLDVLDKTAARVLDAEIGVNHTYLFAELNYAAITGLGFKNKMNLSDTSWNAGVAFEF